MLNKLKKNYDCKYQDQIFSVGDMVPLSTKNLILPGICKLQPWFVDPFQVMSTGPGAHYLDPLPSRAAVHPWFHTSLLKPAWPQPAGPLTLEDDSYEVEAILHINKHGTHAKLK